MSQLYCQLSSRPNPWLLGRTSAGLCTLQTACPLTVTYSGGSPAADTIAAGSAATVYGGSAAAFDASADVWVVLTVAGAGALQVVKEADVTTVAGDWAGLARVVQHSTEPYQPQAYLAAGGTGNAAQSGTTLSSTPGQGHTFLLGSAPAGWQDLGFDDSAWGPALADVYSVYTLPSAIAGADYICCRTGDRPTSETWLYRYNFTLPVGPVSAATLQVDPDDYLRGAWVNGTLLAGSDQGTVNPRALQTVSVPASLLVAGGANVLALTMENNISGGGSGGPSRLAHSLVISSVPTGGLPAPGSPVEGDLLSYQGGAWVRVPIGTTGQELTVVAGDPAWATPTASGVTSIAVAAPSPLSSSGGPITSSGTITLAWASGQTANRVLASPSGSSGTVSLRALVGDDIPVDASTIISSAGTIKGNYQAGSGVSISGNTISATGSGGSVTSVALSVPSALLSVSGSPITSSGTFSVSLASQSAHTVLAGPSSGSAAAPTFRALAGTDLPAAASAGGHIHAHGHFL